MTPCSRCVGRRAAGLDRANTPAAGLDRVMGRQDKQGMAAAGGRRVIGDKKQQPATGTSSNKGRRKLSV